MINIKTYLKIPFCLLYFSVSVNAQELSKEEVIAFTKSFIKEKIKAPANGHFSIQVLGLDPRINLQPCLSPLKANIPEKHNSRNVNVKIYCEDSTPWQLFLPVKIRTMIPVVVTNANISKNTKLDQSNIMVVHKDKQKVHGSVLSEIQQLIGTKAKRNLSAGAKITKRNVCFVCKGDDVTIVAKSNDFVIKTAGVALKDGAIGDKVSVKNKHSNRTVTARVKSINKVVINL